MPCNLYGKLPTKRDFVAMGATRDFLDQWEPWLQSGVSASQAMLKDQWQQAFLRAPIWRFWLGADLCGVTMIGAFMPSLDKVGRYFPLTSLPAPTRARRSRLPKSMRRTIGSRPPRTF